MEKEEGFDISREQIDFLNQAITSLIQAEQKLEESFRNKNPNQFNSVKKFMLKLNEKILEVL